MEQATVMFEFDGMVENGEISLVAGEIVTIYRKDVGDGWWEGKTQNGESGLFPAAYVEVLQNGNHLQSVSKCKVVLLFVLAFLLSFMFWLLTDFDSFMPSILNLMRF